MIAAAILFALFAAVFVLRSIKVVPDDQAFVVERLGRFHHTLQPGLHVLVPLLDRIAFRYSLAPQDGELTDSCITLDNVAVSIRSAFRWQIVDPQRAAYAAASPADFIAGLVRAAQRTFVGQWPWSDVRETRRELQQSVLRTTAEPAAAAGMRLLTVEVERIERSAPVSRSPMGDTITADTALLARIIAFIRSVGIEVIEREIDRATLVPGIDIDEGRLIVEPSKLCKPADLLHEAGHIALTPRIRRPALDGTIAGTPAEEMGAIGWTWAAAVHLAIEPTEVFHDDVISGNGAWLHENFTEGRFIGVPLLQYLGLASEKGAPERGVEPYPHMIRWTRD